MRAPLVLLALLGSGLAAANLAVAGQIPPLPVPFALPPWLAPHGAAPFGTVTCPLLPSPDPARPLERCNVRATDQTGPASEMSLAMDPRDPAHLVVVAKGFNYARLLKSSFHGGVITPYSTSFDGGRTWTEGYLQPLDQVLLTLPTGEPLGETTRHESDPVAGFGADGQPLVMTLRTNLGGGLPVYRSPDGGRTFAQAGSAFQGGTDKEWFVSDPASGNLYAGTLFGGGIGFTKSADGGRTWTPAVKVLTGSYVTLDVGPHGEIYVASNGGSTIHFTRSLDQGATWEPQRDIGAETSSFEIVDGRVFRTPDFAELAASHRDGELYAVSVLPGRTLPASGGPVQDLGIFVVRSADYGLTWSAPVRVDDGLPAFRFMPEIALSPKGDVHVAWLDQRDDPSGQTVEAFYAHSADGARSFERNLKLSDQPFVAALGHHQDLQNGPFIGDYMGLSASDDRAVVAFPDTRYGRADAFVATIV